MSNFEKKFKKFIRYLKMMGTIDGQIKDEKIIDENKAYLRIVPHNFDVIEIPNFKRYCKMIGFDIDNVFERDFSRKNGYRDYHDCIITKNENFNKEFTLEELYEQ